MSTGRNSIWIISPAADLSLLILTPLAIIPLVTWLSAVVLTPEAIALGVFAFASLGHHLPGLMRAYGDRELFRQFRWRFLLAPPLAVAVCWLSFVTLKLHGLELLLLLWATWHILMQTYGFMRIYDMKQGRADRRHANWDFSACLAVFAVGMLFSDVRMFGLTETLWMAGGPMFGPGWLTAARWLVGLAAAAVAIGYVATTLRAGDRLTSANWPKLLLLATTALLYWWSGSLSVNLLIGVAMFDIFHAIQYDAIVWYYNRRRAEKAGAAACLLAWLFHARWWALPLYVGAIAAFGGLGFWVRGGGGGGAAAQVGMALFAASAMLHFYYDGFIWKVSQPATGENLSIASRMALPVSPGTFRHAAGWVAFGSVLLVLGTLQWRSGPASAHEAQRLEALATMMPELPELQLRLSQRAMVEGRWQAAYDAARRAAELRPRSFTAQLTLGDAAFALHHWDTAEQALRTAVAIDPNDPAPRSQLAELYFRRGEADVQQQSYDTARKALEQCLALQPKHPQAHYQLGSLLLLTQHPREAADHFRLCLEAAPEFCDAYNSLGAALYQADALPEAAAAYRRSIELQPQFAPAHYNLGLVLIAQGETTAARRCVLRAASLGQHPSPEVLRAVGL